MTKPETKPSTITVETTRDGRVSTQTFWTEDQAAEYEARAGRLGATTRRIEFVHPLLRAGC